MKKQLLTLLAILMVSVALAQGTWHKISSNAPHNSGGLMLLLTDGTIMCKSSDGGGSGNIWMKLTPNANGSYLNGTWSTLASMANDRLYFASEVLQDGRVYVAGGEYGVGGDFAEVYDPVANSWTNIPNSGGHISDANSEILPDGRVLQSMLNGSLRNSQIFDPKTNSYSAGPTSNGNPNESAWVKLPDNSILMVNIGTRNSERYIPSLGKWITDATVPVDLYDPYGGESGTAYMLPDGRAFFTGSPGTTAYYTPSGNTDKGTWSAGPAIPNAQGQPDAPGAMMPNGKILLAVNPVPTDANHFIAPTTFYEFNYLTNGFTQIKSPTGATSENYQTFVSNMLVLPDGNIMYGNQGNSAYYIYTPDGTPLTAGKPTINQVSSADCSGSSYNISGTKFNGISEGASYGDDWQMSTNYPIVKLTNGTNVYYARTTNWDNTGVQTGATVSNAQFTLPAGLPNGTYSLTVTANGISSDPVSFTPSNGCIITAFKDCSYGGTASALNVGNYTTAQMNAIGILDNDISSIKVSEGYKVILYDGDNFTGNSTTITSSTSCLVASSFNDLTSSIQVVTNGVTNLAGSYFIQNRNSALFMDVAGASTVNGGNIQQWTPNASSAQEFVFTHLGNGLYEILNSNSGKSIDVAGVNNADGTNVQQWDYVAGGNQQFIVTSTGDGFYKLIPQFSGKVVEVAGASTAAGGNVQQWTNNNQTCGQWNFIAPSTGPVTAYKDCNYSGFSAGLNIGDYTQGQLALLGITANSLSSMSLPEGYKAILYANDNFTGASVTLTSSNTCIGNFNDMTSSIQIRANGVPNLGGTYFIQNRNSGLFMDVWGAGTADGTNIAQGTFNGGSNQQYTFTDLGNGRYQILTVLSGKSVDVSAISTADGANVQEWTYYDTPNQQFIVVSTADGFYKLIPSHSGKVIEVANAAMTNGGNIQQWTNNNQTCGQWNFISATDKPLVSITAPANNYLVNEPATFTITATATDAQTAISKVDFYSGTTLLGSDTTTPYTFAWNSAAAGTYQITAKATNAVNNMTTSSAITVVVNKAPTVSLTSPSNNTSFVAAATINIAATAADSDGTVSKVEFYNGTTLLGSDAASPYTYSWTGVATGTYSITAKAYDNTIGITTSTAVSVTVKTNVLPTVTFTAPKNNASYVIGSIITMTATATDSDGNIAKVEFYNGNTLLGTASASPYTYSLTNAVAGTYKLTAVATDNNGGKTTSALVTVVVSQATDMEDITTDINTKIYPNPTTGILNIGNSISLVELFNINGQSVETFQITDQKTIDLTVHPSGVYILRIESKNGTHFEKILKID